MEKQLHAIVDVALHITFVQCNSSPSRRANILCNFDSHSPACNKSANVSVESFERIPMNSTQAHIRTLIIVCHSICDVTDISLHITFRVRHSSVTNLREKRHNVLWHGTELIIIYEIKRPQFLNHGTVGLSISYTMSHWLREKDSC